MNKKKIESSLKLLFRIEEELKKGIVDGHFYSSARARNFVLKLKDRFEIIHYDMPPGYPAIIVSPQEKDNVLKEIRLIIGDSPIETIVWKKKDGDKIIIVPKRN